MKRLLAMTLAVLLVVSMVACSKSPVADNHETEGTEPSTTGCPHDFVADKTEDPTCEKEGYTLYICVLCEVTEERDKTEKLEHTYTSQVTPPTTEKEGYTTHTCEVCGYSYEDNYTEKLPEDATAVAHTHQFTDTVKAPTCTTEGYTTHKCTCGESYNDTKMPATGHKYTDTVVAPTCTTDGYTSHTCSQCKNVYKDSTTSKLGHNYTSKVVDPTRDAQGYTEHTCTRCGDSYKDNYKDKLGAFEKPTEHTHSYTETVTAATCTAEGYTTYTCACGNSYVDNKTPLADHQYQDTKTDATCTAEGYTTHRCKNCGSAYTDTKVAALGHSYTDTVVDPTCEDKGYTEHKCDRCGNTTKDTYINAIGHAYSFTSDTATCTQDGTYTETCGNCGGTKTSHSAAKGHGETQTNTTAASCQQDGITQTICTVCNEVLSETTTPALGSCNYVTETAGKAGEYLSNSLNTNLTRNAWITVWRDTVNVDICYGCGSVKNPRIINQGASAMLSYVNELRRSVGQNTLELDSACMTIAQLRAKEVYSNFSHAGSKRPDGFVSYSENIVQGTSASAYDHYMRWFNSSGHYGTMIGSTWTHMGFGMYLPSDAIERGNAVVTGVQVFAGGTFD